MSIMNSFHNSPRLLTKNNENNVMRNLTGKQAVTSIKPKKKALLDVGNTINHQKQIRSEGKKSVGKWNLEEQSVAALKNISPACSPSLEGDNDVTDTHNWSVCDKCVEDEQDGFLPNFQFTPQQLNSFALDWEVKPNPSELQFREIEWMQIEEPKSPDCSALYGNPWFDIDSNFTLMSPIY